MRGHHSHCVYHCDEQGIPLLNTSHGVCAPHAPHSGATAAASLAVARHQPGLLRARAAVTSSAAKRSIDLCVNQYVFHYASNYLCFSTRFSPLHHRGNHVIVIILWWTIVARCKQKVTLQRGKTCIAKRPWQQATKGVGIWWVV